MTRTTSCWTCPRNRRYLFNFAISAEVRALVVTTPARNKSCTTCCYMAEKVNLQVRGVIENMSWFRGDDGKRYDIFGSGGGEALASELDVPLLGQVPLVTELREGGDVGSPIVVSDPTSEASTAFVEMARLSPKSVAYSPIQRGLKLV